MLDLETCPACGKDYLAKYAECPECEHELTTQEKERNRIQSGIARMAELKRQRQADQK